MKQSFIAIALLGNVLWVAPIEASSMLSNESVTLSQMATSIGIYSKLHDEKPVTSWVQVREVFNLDAANRTLRDGASAGYPLEDHYEFITQTVPYPGYEGSQILLVRAIPLQRAADKPKFRYIVGRSKDGTTTSLHVPEEQVQAMFQKAGVPLPTPKPGLPAVELETMPSAEEIYAQTAPAAAASPLPSSANKLAPTPTQATPRPAATDAPAATVAAKESPSPSFPIVLVVIIVAVIIGVIVFLIRRK